MPLQIGKKCETYEVPASVSIQIFKKYTFSTIVNPSSFSVRCPLYTVLSGWLSQNSFLYQTLCSLCSTALTSQFIWWPYVVHP